jgi:menaquinone-dependent protoporphyrinogen oxidase
MDKPIGIIYSTVDGHTLKICKAIGVQLIDAGLRVQLHSIEQFDKRVTDFNSLIIGASVRYGKHNRLITEFILKNKESLNKIQTAFFSVNLVARKEEKSSPCNNPFLIKFLEEVKWHPDIVDVFAGQLDYSRYSFFDKLMVRLIMKFTNGPTKTDRPIIYTNWEKVRQFGENALKFRTNVSTASLL